MASIELRSQLNSFIRSLQDQGILDHNFDLVAERGCPANPYFRVEVISTFSDDAESGIASINNYLNAPVIDYMKVMNVAHQIKGASSSIGGRHLTYACRDLRDTCDSMNKEKSILAFERVKREYMALKNGFQHISQMERALIAGKRHL